LFIQIITNLKLIALIGVVLLVVVLGIVFVYLDLKPTTLAKIYGIYRALQIFCFICDTSISTQTHTQTHTVRVCVCMFTRINLLVCVCVCACASGCVYVCV